MGIVFEIMPFVIYPTLVLVSAAIGIYLLVAKSEDLMDRYLSMIYSLTNEPPEETENSRYVIWSSRACGIAALLFSLTMAIVAYFSIFT